MTTKHPTLTPLCSLTPARLHHGVRILSCLASNLISAPKGSLNLTTLSVKWGMWWGFSELTFAKTQWRAVITQEGRVHPSWEGSGGQGTLLLQNLPSEDRHSSNTADLGSLTSKDNICAYRTSFNSYPDYFCLCPKLLRLRALGLSASFIVMKFVSMAKAEYFLQMHSCFLSQCVRVEKLRAPGPIQESLF